MATSEDIKKRALELSEKTDSNSISPKEVGGIMHDLASLGENALRNGGTLGIRKVYASIAEMEADKNPKDLWGNPLKKGNLVVIYDGTTTGTDNNKVYAYMNPGWQLATYLDAGYATRSELSELASEVGDASFNAFNEINNSFYINKYDVKQGYIKQDNTIEINTKNVYTETYFPAPKSKYLKFNTKSTHLNGYLYFFKCIEYDSNKNIINYPSTSFLYTANASLSLQENTSYIRFYFTRDYGSTPSVAFPVTDFPNGYIKAKTSQTIGTIDERLSSIESSLESKKQEIDKLKANDVNLKDSLSDYSTVNDNFTYIKPSEIVLSQKIDEQTGDIVGSWPYEAATSKYYKAPDNGIFRALVFNNTDTYLYFISIFCYDKNKKYIGKATPYVLANTTIKLLDNTYYIRFTINVNTIDVEPVYVAVEQFTDYTIGFIEGEGLYSSNSYIKHLEKKNITNTSIIERLCDSIGFSIYKNPLYVENMPDVSVYNGENGYYYCIATNNIDNYKILRSQNLIDWESVNYNPISQNAIQHIKNNYSNVTQLWAPCVKKVGDLYNMYISIGNKATIVLISSYPDRDFDFKNGEFNILLDKSITGIDCGYEDSFCYNDNGQLYLFWGSGGLIYCVKLNSDGTSLLDNNYKRVINSTAKGITHEGTYILKKDNYYYYFGSGGYYENHTYRIVVGRSTNIEGPYLDRNGNEIGQSYGEIIMTNERFDNFYGVGHNGEIFIDSLGRTYMFLHAYVIGVGSYGNRHLCLQELKWDKDGFPYVDGNTLQEIGVAPKLPVFIYE